MTYGTKTYGAGGCTCELTPRDAKKAPSIVGVGYSKMRLVGNGGLCKRRARFASSSGAIAESSPCSKKPRSSASLGGCDRGAIPSNVNRSHRLSTALGGGETGSLVWYREGFLGIRERGVSVGGIVGW